MESRVAALTAEAGVTLLEAQRAAVSGVNIDEEAITIMTEAMVCSAVDYLQAAAAR